MRGTIKRTRSLVPRVCPQWTTLFEASPTRTRVLFPFPALTSSKRVSRSPSKNIHDRRPRPRTRPLHSMFLGFAMLVEDPKCQQFVWVGVSNPLPLPRGCKKRQRNLTPRSIAPSLSLGPRSTVMASEKPTEADAALSCLALSLTCLFCPAC